MAPDLIIDQLGTNDARLGKSADSYEAGLRALIARYRMASPHCGVILVLPAESGPAAGSSLYRQYHARLAKIRADTKNVEILSTYDFWAGYSVSSTQGVWNDNQHPSLSGGYLNAQMIMHRLLRG